MSGISVDDLGTAVENTVFTVVGLGILGVQHLQVQRRALERRVGETARVVAEQFERAAPGR